MKPDYVGLHTYVHFPKLNQKHSPSLQSQSCYSKCEDKKGNTGEKKQKKTNSADTGNLFPCLIIAMLMSCHFRGGWMEQTSAADKINSATPNILSQVRRDKMEVSLHSPPPPSKPSQGLKLGKCLFLSCSHLKKAIGAAIFNLIDHFISIVSSPQSVSSEPLLFCTYKQSLSRLRLRTACLLTTCQQLYFYQCQQCAGDSNTSWQELTASFFFFFFPTATFPCLRILIKCRHCFSRQGGKKTNMIFRFKRKHVPPSIKPVTPPLHQLAATVRR